MKLQKIQLKGFKSFANETNISFGERVIGIVGPNGSGKSNIVDAIRWVLGEQKGKELRLEKMSNIIFNGSKDRKKAGMARVTLTFENTKNILPIAYQQVAISRTLYQTGESEYRINDTVCRLKDIQNLFIDSGIGSDSYAIIALGMVDDILLDKENARRRMFEQAAQISKYKKRKKETFSKLKQTTADLDRVEDLLHEIEHNLKSLEKQAKRAKSFKKLKEKYQEKGILLAKHQLKQLQEQQEKLNQDHKQHLFALREKEAQRNTLEAKLEKTKKEQLDKEIKRSEQQKSINNLLDKTREKENTLRTLEQKKSYIIESVDMLNRQLIEEKPKLKQLSEDIQYYTNQQKTEEEKLVKLQSELSQKEVSRNQWKKKHQSISEEVNSAIQLVKKYEDAIIAIEKNIAIKENEKKNIENTLKSGFENYEKQRTKLKESDFEIQTIEKEYKATEDHIGILKQKQEKNKKEIRRIEQQLTEVKNKENTLRSSIEITKNEYKLLKSMVDNMEGFPESSKYIKKNLPQEKYSILSDLIYCKEKYRPALEAYLEPYLNHFVVSSAEDAAAAIQQLKKTQKGKASFFILEHITHSHTPTSPYNSLIPALSVVEYDKHYEPLWKMLLHNTYISKEENNSFKYEQGITVISPNGDIVFEKHSIKGGSVGLFEGKMLGREKQLKKLSKKIKNIEQEQKDIFLEKKKLEKKLENEKKEDPTARIRQKEQHFYTLQNKLTHLQSGQTLLLEQINQFEQNQEKLKDKDISLQKEIQEHTEGKDIIKKDISDHKKLTGKHEETLQNALFSLQKISEEYNTMNVGLIKQQNTLERYKQEKDFREKKLNDLQNQIEKNHKEIASSQSRTKEIDALSEQIQSKLELLYEKQSKLKETLDRTEAEFYESRKDIHHKESEIKNINRTLQQLSATATKAKDRVITNKMKLSNTQERLKIQYQINPDELDFTSMPDLDNVEQAEEKLQRLKIRIETYGDVNPLAIDAYNEAEERRDHITQQRDDILEAKEDLLKTIEEIDQTATTRFLESFEQVKTNFKDVFRSLFTENDDCDLILEDPDNPLESKIKIIAKPKGKRPQSINQLSGGEKTLTAIALLFALYLLKPAPFCIFDEVDAPLDDANIEKFNKIIRKFSQNSQFIIVTHNKGTMATVDVIYGIYMEKSGISKVAPVDFRSYEYTA